jgi:hypothetical protein
MESNFIIANILKNKACVELLSVISDGGNIDLTRFEEALDNYDVSRKNNVLAKVHHEILLDKMEQTGQEIITLKNDNMELQKTRGELLQNLVHIEQKEVKKSSRNNKNRDRTLMLVNRTTTYTASRADQEAAIAAEVEKRKNIEEARNTEIKKKNTVVKKRVKQNQAIRKTNRSISNTADNIKINTENLNIISKECQLAESNCELRANDVESADKVALIRAMEISLALEWDGDELFTHNQIMAGTMLTDMLLDMSEARYIETSQTSQVSDVLLIEPFQSVDTVSFVEQLDMDDSVSFVEQLDTVSFVEQLDTVDSDISVDLVDTIDPGVSVDLVVSVDTIDPGDSVDLVDTVDTINPDVPVDLVVSVDTIDPDDSVDLVDTIDSGKQCDLDMSVDLVDTIDPDDSVDLVDTVDTINPDVPVDLVDSYVLGYKCFLCKKWKLTDKPHCTCKCPFCYIKCCDECYDNPNQQRKLQYYCCNDNNDGFG